MTPWHYEDEMCWIADCEACDVPMVVWRHHGPTPPPPSVARMLEHLARVATSQFGAGEYVIDQTMRQIPEHFHAHARRVWRGFNR